MKSIDTSKVQCVREVCAATFKALKKCKTCAASCQINPKVMGDWR